MTHILNLFRSTPFDPLYKHRLKVKECTNLVKPLFESILSGDHEEHQRLTKQICDAEKEAEGAMLVKSDMPVPDVDIKSGSSWL